MCISERFQRGAPRIPRRPKAVVCEPWLHAGPLLSIWHSLKRLARYGSGQLLPLHLLSSVTMMQENEVARRRKIDSDDFVSLAVDHEFRRWEVRKLICRAESLIQYAGELANEAIGSCAVAFVGEIQRSRRRRGVERPRLRIVYVQEP